MILALYIANLKEFLRFRMSLFWTIAFPVIFILLFGAVFSKGDEISFKVGVVNEEQNKVSQAIVQAFRETNVLEVFEDGKEEEMEKFKNGERDFVVIIPKETAQNIASKKETAVEISYDPASLTTASAGLPIVRQVLFAVEKQINNSPSLLTLNLSKLQTKDLRSIDYLLPGILAMSLMQLGLFATAHPLVQLREKGVLRRLKATPLPSIYILISQLLFRLTVGLSQTVIIIVLGNIVFNVQVVGNLFLLGGFILLGALTFISMGYLIAGLASSVEVATSISQLINFPMMFLSGIFFSVEMMPDFLRPIIKAMPLSYLGDALRQIMVESTPLYSLQVDALVLGAWLIVCSILAVRFFRWE